MRIYRWNCIAERTSSAVLCWGDCIEKKFRVVSCSAIDFCREFQVWTCFELLILLVRARDTSSVADWIQIWLFSETGLNESASFWVQRSTVSCKGTLGSDYLCNTATVHFNKNILVESFAIKNCLANPVLCKPYSQVNTKHLGFWFESTACSKIDGSKNVSSFWPAHHIGLFSCLLF